MIRFCTGALPRRGALALLLVSLAQSACDSEPVKGSTPETPAPEAPVPSDIDAVLELARDQVAKSEQNHPDKTLHPTVTVDAREGGPWKVQDRTHWRSAFFAGSEWLLHEHFAGSELGDDAAARTDDFNDEVTRDQDHDVGFKVLLTFGHGLRITGASDYRAKILAGAGTLARRYNMESATSAGQPTSVGAIRSWDFNLGSSSTTWNYPVIVDNMMTLEALFLAADLTSDADDRSLWRAIAVSHAQKTAAWHIRPDGSTYHVVDFNNDGTLRKFTTYQGKGVNSTWARGQAWTLYGMTMAYLATRGDPDHGGDAGTFLDAARRTAGYFLDNLPRKAAPSAADRVPYHDLDATSADEPRDSSAAAVAAAGLVRLSLIEEIGAEDREAFRAQAQAILAQLGASYLATDSVDESILYKATTSYNETAPEPRAGNVDVEVGLVYGDYYFLEALLRYRSAYGGSIGVTP